MTGSPVPGMPIETLLGGDKVALLLGHFASAAGPLNIVLESMSSIRDLVKYPIRATWRAEIRN